MKIAIIGCGNMGLMYARAFLKYQLTSKENLLLVEKNNLREQELRQLDTGRVTAIEDPAIGTSDVVVIAVKPQDFEATATALKKVLLPGNIIVSIMAGIKIACIENRLGQKSIVRAMPNAPAGTGTGMTAFVHNKCLPAGALQKVEHLLGTTGRIMSFENEDLLNAVTALSGSGPAYFFYLVKHMVEAGIQMGLDKTVSSILVKQTMLGSFHLLDNASQSPEELIRTVASKGGTTEAALCIFKETLIGENLQKGIIKARDRACDLSG